MMTGTRYPKPLRGDLLHKGAYISGKLSDLNNGDKFLIGGQEQTIAKFIEYFPGENRSLVKYRDR